MELQWVGDIKTNQESMGKLKLQKGWKNVDWDNIPIF